MFPYERLEIQNLQCIKRTREKKEKKMQNWRATLQCSTNGLLYTVYATINTNKKASTTGYKTTKDDFISL